MRCTRCPELCASRSRIVLPTPGRHGGLLAIGEAPGRAEDETGIGFTGAAGKVLDALLAEHGIERAAYGRANICRCRPPGNRRPTRQEADACLPYLADFILETRPRVLLLVGNTAAGYFMGPGSLFQHIERSHRPDGVWLDPSACHPRLRALARSGQLAVAMPHTSGLAWHRKAPNGRLWRELGRRQVALAVDLLVRYTPLR